MWTLIEVKSSFLLSSDLYGAKEVCNPRKIDFLNGADFEDSVDVEISFQVLLSKWG